MSKYKHITPALVKDVRDVIAQADAHKLSIGKIFGAANAVFKTNDPLQNCPSCLRHRVKLLRAWLAQYEADNKGKAPAVAANNGTGADGGVGGAGHHDGDGVGLSNGFTADEEAALMEMLGVTTESTPAEYADALREYLANTTDLDPVDVEKVNVKLATLPAAVEPPAPQYTDAGGPGFVAPAEGAVRYLGAKKLDAEGKPGDAEVIGDFTASAEDPNKGVIANPVTGKGLAPGKYVVDGRNLSVQIGGRATFKVEDLT